MKTNDSPLSASVRELIHRYLDSVELLEVLLLLQRNQKEWTISQITLELQSSENSIRNRVKALVACGFLSASGSERFAYAPKQKELDRAVTELASLYANYRYRVIDEIYRTGGKGRGGMMDFANAFKLRKERSDG